MIPESNGNLQPLDLREAFIHSAMCDIVSVLQGNLKLTIRPWGSAQLQHLKPMIVRVFREFKNRQANKREDDEIWDVVLDILAQDEYYNDVRHMVYVSLERDNEEIIFQEKKYKLFTEEQFRDWLPAEDIWGIVKIVWKQNFAKNLSTVSAPQKENSQEEEKAEAESATPQ